MRTESERAKRRNVKTPYKVEKEMRGVDNKRYLYSESDGGYVEESVGRMREELHCAVDGKRKETKLKIRESYNRVRGLRMVTNRKKHWIIFQPSGEDTNRLFSCSCFTSSPCTT